VRIKLESGGETLFPMGDDGIVMLGRRMYVPKKTGITLVKNKNDELIPTRISSGWRMYVDYRKLNLSTRKDHFPLPFMDQMLECLAGKSFYCY